MQHNLFRRFSLLLLTLAVLSGCVTGPNEQGFRTISQKSARRLMDKRTVTVVDVREAAEYAAGHLPGAILLPLGTITAETAAAAMREFDEEVFRKERTFQDKTPSRIEYWDDPRLDNPVEYFSRLTKDLDTQLENISPGLSQKATLRDKEILLLAAAGFTQCEIAVKLHISQVAVLKHLHKLQKLLKRGL